MKKSELKEIIKNIVEELCAKGKAYRKRRMAAGEKSSAYLSGRAVKVCKGQIKGEAEDAAMKKSALGMAMYGKKAKMNEAEGQVNVFGYQTKHFDICHGAQGLYKEEADKAQQIANAIMKLAQRMGLKSEHQYVQGHVDKIKEKIKEEIEEDIEAKDNTEFKITLKHLLDKHVSKGGEEDDD